MQKVINGIEINSYTSYSGAAGKDTEVKELFGLPTKKGMVFVEEDGRVLGIVRFHVIKPYFGFEGELDWAVLEITLEDRRTLRYPSNSLAQMQA